MLGIMKDPNVPSTNTPYQHPINPSRCPSCIQPPTGQIVSMCGAS